MKTCHRTSFTALFTTALAFAPALAHAHPGHSAFDWTVLPHGGHLSEHAFLFTILALATAGFVAYRAASRKR